MFDSIIKIKFQSEEDSLSYFDEIVAGLAEENRQDFFELFIGLIVEGDTFSEAIRIALDIIEQDKLEFAAQVQIREYTKSDGTVVKAHARNIDGGVATETEEKGTIGKIAGAIKKVSEKALGAMTKSLENDGYSPTQAKVIIGVSAAAGFIPPALVIPGSAMGTAAIGYLGAKVTAKVKNKIKEYKEKQKTKTQEAITRGEEKVAKPEGETSTIPDVGGGILQKVVNKIFRFFNVYNDQRKYDKIAREQEEAKKRGKRYGEKSEDFLRKQKAEGKYAPAQKVYSQATIKIKFQADGG